jgi:hypothetical protein
MRRGRGVLHALDEGRRDGSEAPGDEHEDPAAVEGRNRVAAAGNAQYGDQDRDAEDEAELATSAGALGGRTKKRRVGSGSAGRGRG